MTAEPQKAISRWHNQVRLHHSQSISAQQNFDPNQDFWKGVSHHFKDDPFRKGDALIGLLEKEFVDCETLVDIGGGAGRLALPLSLTRKKVTVVDSSKSMLADLKGSCEEAQIDNVESIFSLWEDAAIDIHEGALCSHVTYGIEDIEKFLKNVNRYANKRVVKRSNEGDYSAFKGRASSQKVLAEVIENMQLYLLSLQRVIQGRDDEDLDEIIEELWDDADSLDWYTENHE